MQRRFMAGTQKALFDGEFRAIFAMNFAMDL